MNTLLRPALVLFVALSLLTGIAYPLAVTGLAQTLFPAQAAGSLIVKDGKAVGSELIGQSFSDPKHFWGRPSATGPMAYNAQASSGSNQGPLNPALADAVKARIAALREADPGNTAARYQAPRVARLRGVPLAQVEALVEQHTQGRWLGFMGEPRVAVLPLNLALDAAQP